jgi:hypothetical protein
MKTQTFYNPSELVWLAMLTLQHLEDVEDLSRTYGDFLDHLRELQQDLIRPRRPGELACTVRTTTTTRKRCTCR